MKIEFAQYHENDYDEFKEMVFGLYREDPEGEPMDEEKLQRTIRECRAHPDKLSLYMFSNQGQKIGYAILVYFWSNEHGGNVVSIDELYVKEKYRGKGVATGFIEFAHHLENAVSLQLEVTPSNQRTMAFYQRMGFQQSANFHLYKPFISTPVK